MIIKIIPEENENVTETEHHNVREFFICGTKKDIEGTVLDFHDWNGQYRYLIGSLYYYLKQIEGEQSDRGARSKLKLHNDSKKESKVKKEVIKEPSEITENKQDLKIISIDPINVEEIKDEKTQKPEEIVEEQKLEEIVEIKEGQEKQEGLQLLENINAESNLVIKDIE